METKKVADLAKDAAEKEKKDNELSMQQTMMLIVNAGNAKAFAKEAIDAAKKHDFKLADEKIKSANDALVEAHNTQTGMLTEEARGNHAKLSLLVVHAQDHLMTAITYIDLAQEIVAVYKQVASSK